MLLQIISTFVIFTIHTVLSANDVFLSVVFYDEINEGGHNVTIEVNGCQNVPGDWNDRVSSMHLNGRCLRLYKDQDCTGRMMTMTPVNRIWLTDLKSVNFNDMISSISSCRPESPKLESGRYAIQSPWDSGVLTVRRLIGGYTMLKTMRWRKDFTQQWDIEKNDDDTYLMTPRMFEHNSMTYDIDPSEKYPTARVNWVIESLHNQMYSLRKSPSNLCLTMRPKMEIQMKYCREEDKTQHWIFHRVRGGSD